MLTLIISALISNIQISLCPLQISVINVKLTLTWSLLFREIVSSPLMKNIHIFLETSEEIWSLSRAFLSEVKWDQLSTVSDILISWYSPSDVTYPLSLIFQNKTTKHFVRIWECFISARRSASVREGASKEARRRCFTAMERWDLPQKRSFTPPNPKTNPNFLFNLKVYFL